MRAQIILEGGPLDQEMSTISSKFGVWPTEIRVASGDLRKETGKVECMAYNYGHVEKIEGFIAPIYVGTYEFVGMKQSAVTLITVWT